MEVDNKPVLCLITTSRRRFVRALNRRQHRQWIQSFYEVGLLKNPEKVADLLRSPAGPTRKKLKDEGPDMIDLGQASTVKNYRKLCPKCRFKHKTEMKAKNCLNCGESLLVVVRNMQDLMTTTPSIDSNN